MKMMKLLAVIVVLLALVLVCTHMINNGPGNNAEARVLTYRVHVDRFGPEPVLVLDELTAVHSRYIDDGVYAYDTLTLASFDSLSVEGIGMFNQIIFQKNDSGIDRKHAVVYLALGDWKSMKSQERR